MNDRELDIIVEKLKHESRISNGWEYSERHDGICLIKYVGTQGLRGEICVPDELDDKIVTALEKGIFREYKEIEKIILPHFLKEIGDAAFTICNGLKEILFPPGVSAIPADCFNECGFINLIIPDTIKKVGRGAFVNNRQLENIILPASIEKINIMTFAGCTSLKSIKFPSTVKEIGDGAFSGCQELEDVFLPEGLKRIGNMAFLACKSLEKIYLPVTVSEIGEMAFPSNTMIVQKKVF